MIALPTRVMPSAVACILLLALIPQVGCTLLEKKRDISGYGGLRLEIEIDRSSCVKGGERIHIRYTVTNHYDKPIVIESMDAPVLDLIIDQGSTGPSHKYILFTWSRENPQKTEQRIVWEPGTSKVIETVWTVPQGEFAPGTNAFITGVLRKGSSIVQATGVVLCMGVPFEPR